MKSTHRLLLPLLLPVALIGGLMLALLNELNEQRGAAQAVARDRMALVRELSGLGADLAMLQQQVGEVWGADASGQRDAPSLAPVRADVAQRLALLSQRIVALTSSPGFLTLRAQDGHALRGAFDTYRHEVLVVTSLAGGESVMAARHLAQARARFTDFYQHAQSQLQGLARQAEADDLRRDARAVATLRWMAGGIALGLALTLVLAWLLARALTRHALAGGAAAAEPPAMPPPVAEEAPATGAPDNIGPNDRAFYDALTGLPNRWLVLERLRQAIRISKRRGSGLAVLFLDLDNFAQLNELHGAHKGDLLLKEVAARLLDAVRGSDTVGRLDADEFLVLVEDLPDDPLEADALASLVADKLRAAVGAPYQLDELCCEVSASVGVSLNMDGRPEDIIQTAAAALLAIKRAKAFD